MQPVTDTPIINSIEPTSIVQTISDNHHTVMTLDQIRSLETLHTLPTMNPLITITPMSGITTLATMSSNSNIQNIMPLIGNEQKDVNRFY